VSSQGKGLVSPRCLYPANSLKRVSRPPNWEVDTSSAWPCHWGWQESNLLAGLFFPSAVTWSSFTLPHQGLQQVARIVPGPARNRHVRVPQHHRYATSPYHQPTAYSSGSSAKFYALARALPSLGVLPRSSPSGHPIHIAGFVPVMVRTKSPRERPILTAGIPCGDTGSSSELSHLRATCFARASLSAF
jgi:hypothetical protein